MRYYVTVDNPDHEPDMLFRAPAEGGPPFERYDPATATWNEEPSLVDYFAGDAVGLVPIVEARVPDAMVVVHRRTLAGGLPSDVEG